MPQDPCNGGPSEVKQDIQRTAVVTSSAIEAALGFLAAPLALLLAVPLANFDYDTFTICGEPPPDDPGLTSADAFAVLSFADPSVSAPALEKLHQWFLSWYWYTLCQCAGAATPAAPVPSNPGPSATLNPGLPSGPSVEPCWDASATYAASMPAPVTFWDVSSPWIPTDQPVTVTYPLTGSPQGPAYVMPVGVATFHWKANVVNGQGWSTTRQLMTFRADGSTNGTVNLVDTRVDGAFENQHAIPADTVSWAILDSGAPNATATVTLETWFFCGGQTPSAPSVPCCPPDPLLETQLRRILGYVQSIYGSLPTPLTSTAEGTVHAGLQGNGSFALVDAAVAIKAQLTTIPSAIGEEDANPLLLFDVGYVTPIAAEAPLAGWRIIYNPQLFPLPQLTEQIGYTLAPGVVATFTELVRGP